MGQIELIHVLLLVKHTMETEDKSGPGVGLNDTLFALWQIHFEQCLDIALANDNSKCESDNLFLDDNKNEIDDPDIDIDDTKQRLLNILANIKFFGLTQYAHSHRSALRLSSPNNTSEAGKFWCRLNINELIKNKHDTEYKNNKFINILFHIDPNAEMNWSHGNKTKMHAVKVTTCVFAQYPNLVYNALFDLGYFTESDLIYIILDYLSFDDYTREQSENVLPSNIKPMTITKNEMMKYDLITFHREVVFEDKSKQFAQFGNNKSYISNAYGQIDERLFCLMLVLFRILWRTGIRPFR